MTDFDNIDILSVSDYATADDECVHVHAQQRKGRKSTTSIHGLSKNLDKKKILKTLMKKFCCNGWVVESEKTGKVLQLQGDQRKNVQLFLTQEGIVKKQEKYCNYRVTNVRMCNYF